MVAVKDAVTASIAGRINPLLELNQEAELGHFGVYERERKMEGREQVL